MYKLLIADDERLERSAICSAVQEHMPEIFEIQEAENGKRAVEIGQEFVPDIVLMDIKMPAMNGIDAARAIMQAQPNCKIVMLTGFTYFNYAKECINIGVMDFLVKPSTDEMIVEMLQKAMRAVDEVRSQQENLIQAQKKICLADRYLEGEMLAELLFGGADDSSIHTLVEEMGIAQSSYTVAIFFPDVEYGKQNTNQYLLDICCETVQQLLEPQMQVQLCKHYGRIYLLISTEIQPVRSQLLHWLEEFIRQVTMQQHCVAGIGVSNPSMEALDIPHLVQQAHRAYSKTNAIQFYHLQKQSVMAKEIASADAALCALMRQRQYTELFSQLDLALEALFLYSPEPKGQLCEWLMLLNRTAAEMTTVEPAYMIYGKVMEMKDSQIMKQYAVQFVQRLIDRIICQETAGEDWKHQAEEMILRQYRQELTMEEVAHQVGFSTYYFSRMFKQAFGTSFINYLTAFRLNRAKELLRQPGTSVKEVCYQVGYSEPNYFARVFKREVGMTPSEYQKNANLTN